MPGAAGALTVIAGQLCGIRPLEPGYSVFGVEPDPASFRDVSIRVPTVRGIVGEELRIEGARLSLRVIVPEGHDGRRHAAAGSCRAASGRTISVGRSAARRGEIPETGTYPAEPDFRGLSNRIGVRSGAGWSAGVRILK